MRPQKGDVLAFKILSLNEETWTPELSDYRESEVTVQSHSCLRHFFFFFFVVSLSCRVHVLRRSMILLYVQYK